jgi:hypothetical protein
MTIAITIAVTLICAGAVEFTTPSARDGGGAVPFVLGIILAIGTAIFYAGMMAAK